MKNKNKFLVIILGLVGIAFTVYYFMVHNRNHATQTSEVAIQSVDVTNDTVETQSTDALSLDIGENAEGDVMDINNAEIILNQTSTTQDSPVQKIQENEASVDELGVNKDGEIDAFLSQQGAYQPNDINALAEKLDTLDTQLADIQGILDKEQLRQEYFEINEKMATNENDVVEVDKRLNSIIIRLSSDKLNDE